ncbi:hypothetical protein [Lacrimispora sp.]|uniref:hypothetical protein n=1 Tax=Lacrimispora sp. TaxID=2719234 RepID=UPI002FD87D4E
MSAFLGPIHNWLYNKIQIQNAMVDVILDLAEEKGYSQGLRAKADEQYGAFPEGNLEDLIDTGNIHGWLQEKVSLVEGRMAYAVTELVKENPDRLAEIEAAISEFGRKLSVNGELTVKSAYEYLENTLLNGMPCDRVNALTEETEDKLVWRQTQDIHGSYWQQVNGDVSNYYALREALIRGIFEGTSVEFGQVQDQSYELRRRV